MVDTGGAKILIVDDDAGNRLLLTGLLKIDGYSCEEAGDGA